MSEDGGWRLLGEYERSVLGRLLEVPFPERDAIRGQVADLRVRTMDECGCIEFAQGQRERGEPRVVAEGSGPRDAEGTPVIVTLTLRGERPLWLEFHRFGGANDFRPPGRRVRSGGIGNRQSKIDNW